MTPPAPRRSMNTAVWCAVAAGALVGTEARYFLGLAFPEPEGNFPWTTLIINGAGSLMLGYFASRWATHPATPRWVEAGLGPGMVGSFTTFSAVTLVLAIDLPHPAFIAYLGLSLILGLGAAAAGLSLGSRRPRP